jgi:hypothetical protein
MISLTIAMLMMQSWTPAGSEARGSYSYDPGSVSRSGGNVQVRIRVVLASTAPGGVRSFIMAAEFGCAARTITARSVSTFREDGSLIANQSGQGAAQQIPANTIEDNIRRTLCGG